MKVALIIAGFFSPRRASCGRCGRSWPPGSTAHEKKYAAPFVIVGSLLFIGGGAFSLLVIVPLRICFLLLASAGPGLQPMISIGSYFDFLLKFTLAFGARLRAAAGPDAGARAWAW